jgi:hypothetical protein
VLFSRLEMWPTPAIALKDPIQQASILEAHFQSLSLQKATVLATATDLALPAILQLSS